MTQLQRIEVDHQERCMTYFSAFLTSARRPLYTALISAYVSHQLALMAGL